VECPAAKPQLADGSLDEDSAAIGEDRRAEERGDRSGAWELWCRVTQRALKQVLADKRWEGQ